MVSAATAGLDQRRETAGFLVSVGFVFLGATRDVFLGGLFQRLNPLVIVAVAFSLCTVLFLPAAFVGSRESLIILRRRPIDLLWVNITSAGAWLAFMYALKLIEPSIMQIIYSGIGPLSVILIENKLSSTGRDTPVTDAERLAYLALFASLVFAAAIVLAGLSGGSNQSVREAAFGVSLAAGGGIVISVATMLCRRLNDAGVTPGALLSLRFPAAAVTAVVVLSLSPASPSTELSRLSVLLGIAALLIVAASYVNQFAISLASPLTVRVVLAAGPVLIFFFQMIEGRLSPSPYSLTAGILYGLAAIFAAVTRQRAIRGTRSFVHSPSAQSMLRVAILDDYHNVALKFADWGELGSDVVIKVFRAPVHRTPEETIRDLRGFDVVVMMRERTAFPRGVIEGLPSLKLLITTADRVGSTDMVACAERGITVCGTRKFGDPTIGVTFGLILELTRRIGWENARLKSGETWQAALGTDICGKTLGILGLGTLGKGTARVGAAFGMKVIAWSQNLTPEKCREVGVEYVSKETLFRDADIVSIHLKLSDRTRGLVGGHELGLMKKTAYIVNTARASIIREKALLAALSERRIAGAGLDVFEVEPLPIGHPFRRMENVVITPHLGYVTEQNYAVFYPDVVANIKAWRDGNPSRVIAEI